MTNNPLGVCILGCGMMGNIHAARWSTLPNTRIVSVCDLIADRAQAMANQYCLQTPAGVPVWYLD